MKSVLVSLMLLAGLRVPPGPPASLENFPANPGGNIIIITTDGFRWQEFFTGADSTLINDPAFTPDPETMNALFWASTPEERRKKLLPFCWNLLAPKGQLYGNRHYGNRMNVSNTYAISYPGYNEIFTGHADDFIAANSKKYNPNINVLEYLDTKAAFYGKIGAFTSWDVFPYILNEKRNQLLVNSGYENTAPVLASAHSELIDRVQDECISNKKATRHDQLTYLAARDYLAQYRPRILYLGFGETDEFAHEGRYDLYLQQANAVDRMIAELWHWVQTTPGYKDNTTFIFTTDHGRGRKARKWTSHGALTGGSSETWMAVIGPNIKPLGEIKDNQQHYQQQLAQTIAFLLGEEFEAPQPVASAIPLPAVGNN